MRSSILFPALVAVLATAAPASAFLADNGLIVEKSADGVIDVPFRGLSGASDFWCAAGDYVIRRLHLPPATRIWRLSEPPRRSGEGIRFSLSPDGAATSSGLAKLPPGSSLTAADAQDLCQQSRLLRFGD